MGALYSEIGDNQGDKWTFVCVLPETGFIHTVHTSSRNVEEAALFVEKIKESSDEESPLFMSDSWFYAKDLGDNYCTWEQPLYKGIERKPLEIQVVDPDLCYAQVHK